MNDSNTKVLNDLLADYQVFYQKLRNYHWTVTGPTFFELHQKFEEMYNDAALKVDELAERILAVGGRPLPTLAAAISESRLTEDESSPPANDMVTNVVADLASLNTSLRAAARTFESDSATFNLLEGMADGQEKTAWMLKAYLG